MAYLPQKVSRSPNKLTQLWIGAVTHDTFPILLLLAINLVIGLLIFPTYGESWDEQPRFQYAERSLAAYSGSGRSLIDEKGAFYVMLAKLGSDLIRAIYPALRPIQAWHFIHFLSFLMAVFFLYKICLRFVGKWPAFGTALLFNTSPLLWGHAFINPKDIPFMAFFLASVTLGVEMAWRYLPREPASLEAGLSGKSKKLQAALSTDREKGNRTKRVVWSSLSVLALVLILGLIASTGTLRGFVASQIEQAASPEASGLLSRWFERIAENRAELPVAQYITKSEAILNRLIWLSVLGGLIFSALCLALGYPAAVKALWADLGKPFFRESLLSIKEPKVWLAGIFLGLATSIRVLGPASAVLVAIYFIAKSHWKALPVLTAYASVAFLTLYLTWPYLWGAPISHFLHSLTVASDYPWEGKVRFAGIDYPVTAVPRGYLPTLLTIQTPEVILLLFILGLGVSIYALRKKKLDGEMILIAGLWFFFPLLSAILFQPTMYDNFRQFLFILPAAYLFLACGLWFVLGAIRRTGWRLVLVLLLTLPNLASLVQLHPYQYIYYNRLAGGVSGAFRRFETDYWATSYQAAAAYLNQVANPGETVLVLGPGQIIAHAARPDLDIQDYSPQNTDLPNRPFYVVLNTRYDKDLLLFPDSPEIFREERNGAVLVVVKRVEPN